MKYFQCSVHLKYMCCTMKCLVPVDEHFAHTITQMINSEALLFTKNTLNACTNGKDMIFVFCYKNTNKTSRQTAGRILLLFYQFVMSVCRSKGHHLFNTNIISTLKQTVSAAIIRIR